MNNLHVSLTDLRYESRVLKQTTTISSLSKIEHVYIAALYEDSLKEEEKITDKISLKRFVLKTRGLNKSFFLQIFKYLEFVLRVLFFYKKKKIAIVNIHVLELLPLGYLLKLIYGAKLIYDTHELETEISGLRGYKKKLRKLVERLLIKKTDHVFVVSENIADWYSDTYGIPRPTVLLNSPQEQHVEKNDYFQDKFSLRKDQLIVIYQGGLQVERGINVILEYFKKNKNDKIVIVFMGNGELQREIQFASKSYKNIFFHETVPTDIVLKYTASADIGIVLIQNTCLSHNFCMPNKLFEYAMAGLPVIVSNVKEMSAFVKKNQIGVVVEDETAASLNEAIERLLRMDLAVLKQNVKKAALDNAWERQEEKMQTIYQKLLVSI
jgi:glycosyltransferase involved in cell wall biosynthesis